MQCRIVRQEAVLVFPVISKPLAMIGHEDDERVLERTLFVQITEQLTYDRIAVGDISVVGSVKVLATRWLRRFVRTVRIKQVEPHEEFLLDVLVEPASRLGPRFGAGALNARHRRDVST